MIFEPTFAADTGDNRSLDEKVQQRTQQLLDAEAKLFMAAKMSALGEMAGGIAHEINTPLGTIGMIAEQLNELVNEETIDRKTVSEMTQMVGETVHRISKIIQGLKTFSRDGSQDRFSSVPLREIIESTLILCREKLKHSNVRVTLDPIGDEVRIECRSVQISQVLLNLISNACDAVLPLQEKWIRVSSEKKGGNIQVFITDSGHGIDEKIQSKMFQPFFTTKDIGKGTGLGLSISKGIVDAHHGTLVVDGECKNTRFVLSLPVGSEDVVGLSEQLNKKGA